MYRDTNDRRNRPLIKEHAHLMTDLYQIDFRNGIQSIQVSVEPNSCLYTAITSKCASLRINSNDAINYTILCSIHDGGK